MSEEVEIICTCYHISRQEIEKIANSQNITSALKIARITNAGTNCGRCQKKIKAILDELHEPEKAHQK